MAAALPERRQTRLRVCHAFHSPLMEPMLAEFRRVAEIVRYSAPRIPIVSTVTGEPWAPSCAPPSTGSATSARRSVSTTRSGGWRARASPPSSNSDPTRVLSADGPGLPGRTAGAAPRSSPLLRRDRGELRQAHTAVALAHVRGAALDWQAFFAESGARQVELPTYAFQRRRYWLSSTTSADDASGLGQVAAHHPLLGAVVTLPDSGGAVLTGRVSVRSHPWLADHVISGVVLLPGTGLRRAGRTRR